VLGSGGGEKAFEMLFTDHFCYKRAWAIEESEKTIPIDGQQKGFIRSKKSTAGGKWIFAIPEPGYME
jgi:hypothetical protein